MTTKTLCATCNKRIFKKRITQAFCSVKCRTTYHRETQRLRKNIAYLLKYHDSENVNASIRSAVDMAEIELGNLTERYLDAKGSPLWHF